MRAYFPERGESGVVLLALRLVHPHLEADRREVRADEHISVVRQAAEPAREAQELSGIQILDRRCRIRNIPAKTSHQSHPIQHRGGD